MHDREMSIGDDEQIERERMSVIMGHATISMIFDTYGHLMPGGLDEAAAATTNAYLAKVRVEAR